MPRNRHELFWLASMLAFMVLVTVAAKLFLNEPWRS